MILRPAEPEDAMPVARVHVRAWQVAYRGLMPEITWRGCARKSGHNVTTSPVAIRPNPERW